MERHIKATIQGVPAVDGAGVKLTRVLGNGTMRDFDPFLMLDSFDSTNPPDYIAGFPTHPHRGIETISFLSSGAMTHRDSMGNEDTVRDGEVQWMTAGSGILHEEKLPACPRMLGVQLWLNMPARDKMAPPDYHALKKESIPEISVKGGVLRLLAGRYGQHQGFQGKHLPLTYYDILLEKGASLTLPTDKKENAFVFTLLNDAQVAGETVREKSAALLTEGDQLSIAAPDAPIEILFFSGKSLGEPIAWGGPIVMNTQEELRRAFHELENGTFLKDSVRYE